MDTLGKGFDDGVQSCGLSVEVVVAGRGCGQLGPRLLSEDFGRPDS